MTHIILSLLLLLLINEISTEYCGRISYSGNSGIISKYSLNASYSACTYTIRAPPSRRLKLSWRQFNVNSDMPSCYGTTVTVRVGCQQTKTVAKFCSKNMDSLPHDVYSHDGCMEIWYLRNGAGGFVAEYSTYDIKDVYTASCDDRTIRHLPAVISSPGWPRRIYDSSCTWRIKLDSKYKRMVVNIMDLNGFSYGTSPYGCGSNEYLRVQGVKSITSSTKRSWYFCKSNHRSSFNDAKSKALKYSEIKLRFESRYIDGRRGFIVGIVAYDVPIFTIWTKIGGGVGAIILILIVLSVIVRRCRYRRYVQQQRQQRQEMLADSEPTQDSQLAIQTYYPTPNTQDPGTYPVAQPVPYDQLPYQQPPPYHPPSYQEAVTGTDPRFPYAPSESSEASTQPAQPAQPYPR